MGYWGNVKISRGTFYSGSTLQNIAAGADWEPYLNYRGVLWGVHFSVDAANNSHLSYFDIKINDSVHQRVFPHDQTFLALNTQGWISDIACLTAYAVHGFCSFQFWFPFGIPIDSKLTLKIHNGASVINTVHTIEWWEEY